MNEKKAYRCKDKKCKCWERDWSYRHCPDCDQLYLWDWNNPSEPCADCEVLPDKPLKPTTKKR